MISSHGIHYLPHHQGRSKLHACLILAPPHHVIKGIFFKIKDNQCKPLVNKGCPLDQAKEKSFIKISILMLSNSLKTT